MKDQCNDLKVVSVITPQVETTTDLTGADVDRAGFESVTYVISVGAEGDTLSGSVKLDVKLYESDTATPASSGAVVAAADVIVPKDQSVVLDGTSGIVLTVDANAEAPVLVKLGYKGEKRYTTLVADETGFTNGLAVAAIAILGNGAQRPVT